MKKITLLAMSFIMALTVKAQYGEDVTDLLTNPNFDDGTTGWEGTFVTQGSVQPNFSGTFLERWAGYYALDQSVGGAALKENGVEYYKLIDLQCYQTIQVEPAYYAVEAYVNAVQQNLSDLNPVTGVYLYANDSKVACATGNGQPERFAVGVLVGSDGNLTIGLRTESTTANWVAWDNIKLKKYESEAMYARDEMLLIKEDLELLIENPMNAELRDAINESFDAIETADDAMALWETLKAQAAEAEAIQAADTHRY